jgi:ubiquinone/menaquinone biosynthesis C-methylase UbiE
MTAPDPVQRTARLFDAVADTYDQVGVDFLGPIAEGLVEQLDVRPGTRVLDLGCGRGAVLLRLARKVGPDGLAVGGDVSSRMVELCRDHARAEGLEQVQVEVVDAMDPLASRHVWESVFDRVCASLVLFFLPDPAQAVGRWVTLMRPGATLGVATFGEQDPRWAAVDDLLVPYLPDEVRDARTSGATGPFGSDAGVEGMLTGAGLTAVRTSHQRMDVRFEDPEQWYRFSMSIGQRAMWERVPETDRASLRARAFTLLREAAGPDGSITVWQDVRYTLAERP